MPSMKLSREEAKKLGVDQPSPLRGVGSRKPLPGNEKTRSTTRSKYRNVITEVDGIKFHSKREAHRYGELRLLQKAGKIFDLELQPKFTFVINGKKIGTYTADFCYVDTVSGRAVVEDVKGVKTQQYQLRKKLLSALHGIDVQEV